MQISYPLDETLYTSEYPRLYQATRTSGVFSADTHFLCGPAGGMSISVSPGILWMKLSEFQGAVFASTEIETFTLETANGTYARIDRLTVRFDYIENNVYMYIKTGTPTASPVAPALQRDNDAMEWALCDFEVPRAALQITAANIIDKRLDETVCGVMRDGVSGIPTQSLYDSWWSWFTSLKTDAESRVNELYQWIELFKTDGTNQLSQWFDSKETEFYAWFDQIKGVLSEDALTNLYNLVEQAQQTADSKAYTALYNATIGTTWSGTGPYTQTVNVSGITANMVPSIGIVLSDDTTTAKNQLESWSFVSRVTTGNGNITVYCYEDRPEVAMPIQIKVVE